MSDLISRQAAIDAVRNFEGCENGYSDTYDKAFIISALEELPSAQQWIPVSERLPEVGEAVLVSYHYESVIKYRPPYDGVKIAYWLGSMNHDKPDFAAMGYATTVLAWMPLPKPYEEGK